MDKAQVMKEAQKYLSKGLIDKAIEEWKKLAAAHPDGNTFNTVGDLYIKKGDKNAAIEQYHKAAKFYHDGGFSLKALAIHKKVLNINPKDPTALIALGELNEEKNIITDAIKYYLAAAQILSQDNKKDELLEVYDKILRLAPNNIKLRVKVSDMFSREGFIPEAAKEFANISRLYAERNDMETARGYLKKAIEIQPGNRDILVAMADLHQKSGELKNAIVTLQTAIDRGGEDVDILLKLGAFQTEAGDLNAALASTNKALALDPGNIDVRKQLGDMYQQTGDIMTAWEEYQQILDPLINAERFEEAITILDTFREFSPIDNGLKLATLHKSQGNTNRACKAYYDLHTAYVEKAQINEAYEALKQAEELKPGEAAVQRKLAELDRMLHPPEPDTTAADAQYAAAEDSAPEEPDFEEPVPDFDEPEEEEAPAAPGDKSLAEILNEADVFVKYGLLADAKILLESKKTSYPDSIDLHVKLLQVYRDAKETDSLVTEYIVLGALHKSRGEQSVSQKMLQEAFAISPHDPRLEGKVEGWTPAGPEPAAAAQPFDAQALIDEAMNKHKDELSEAEFYVKQGFYNEAAEIYRKVLKVVPKDEGIRQKLEEIEAKLVEQQEQQSQKAKKKYEEITPFAGEEAESLFDVSSILDEADEPDLGDMDSEVMGIFDEFKKGLAQEIEAEDAETHYDLGIAYKEMGIIDDAIKEFQTAQRDPSYFVQATTMIGICYQDKGAFSLAIDAFTAGLMKVDAHDEKRGSLMYDLGLAYEKNGNLKEALQVYTDVYKWDPNFRDIRNKLALMKEAVGVEDVAPVTAAAPKVEAKPSSRNRVSYI